MNMCTTHWARLRAAISARGMDEYVSKNGQDAVSRIVAGLAEETLATYDPLIAASSAILGHALQLVGPSLLEPPAKCPICFLKNAHERVCRDPECKQDFEEWINLAADGAQVTLSELLAEDAQRRAQGGAADVSQN